MLKVVLKGHDYEYEVSELIKLFTSEFEYVEELQNSEEKFLVNSIEINGKKSNIKNRSLRKWKYNR